MNTLKTDKIINEVRRELLNKRPGKGSMWTGFLSSSAISTSVSVFALHMADKEKYHQQIGNGVQWLKNTMLPDGSWGDSIESPSNMTATLLTYASLHATGETPKETQQFLQQKFNGTTDQHIISGVLKYYGKDLTFSAPILVMCALAGVISSWKEIPQLPFEVSVLPQKLFKFFRLPVVSYAIPALIAVGILRYKKGKKNLLRESFIKRSLKVLIKLQPENGGFLEAAPLTSFVAMCMCGAGYRNHTATQNGIHFLVNTVREDGSWPIDTNLTSWVTSLSIRALGEDVEDAKELTAHIKNNAFTYKHPFTGAKEGGWGWTNLPGSAPDADDTAGALVALHTITKGGFCLEVQKGIEWLMDLQNSDGGIPTFCKGWGKLPFDRSSPDITAHTLLAFQLWHNQLPHPLKKKCEKSTLRMLQWMAKEQSPEGFWIPLWFGDQDAKDELSPVYGTAVTVEYLSDILHPLAEQMANKGISYLLSAQNKDGGWGGAPNVRSKVTLTARALSALSSFENTNQEILHSACKESQVSDKKASFSRFAQAEKCEFTGVNGHFEGKRNKENGGFLQRLDKAFDFLYTQFKNNELYKPEPIGLYFSRLWYSEEMYNITFVLRALKKYQDTRHKYQDKYES